MAKVGDLVIDLRVGGGVGIVTKVNRDSLNYGTKPQLPVAITSVLVVPVISFFTRLYWNYRSKKTTG